jgi:RNA polymerase sigma-70 factor (ECF subfamily)
MTNPSGRERKAELVANTLQVHSNEFKAFVRARVPSAEVDDVLQTAAIRAIEKAESLQDQARVLPWLYRLHRNIVTDAMRKLASQHRLIDDTASTLEVPPQQSTRNPCGCSLSQARSIKPPAYALILMLVDSGDTSLSEAARILGISVNNAAVRLHRAREKLRKTMREHCGVTNLRECADCRCVHEGCCSD